MLLLVKYPYMDSVGMREPEIDDLELLERSCSMFVLRYLLHHPRKNKTEIMSTEGRNLTTKNRRMSRKATGGRQSTPCRTREDASPSIWMRSAPYSTRSGRG